MSEFKDGLEQERRRFAMGGDSMRDLERRRDRKRRNRRFASGVVGLLIAVAGVGGGLYAFRPSRTAQPIVSPTPSGGPSIPTPGPSPTETTPSPTPPVIVLAGQVSGPLQFIDDQHGWAVVNGKVLVTSDSGRTWQPKDIGSPSVDAVEFLDLQHGWAIGAGGLRATTDGGLTWELVSHKEFTTLAFLDAVRGLGTSSGQLLETGDGGRSWSAKGFSADSVCAANRDVVWAAGLGGNGGTSFYRSADGGATWTESPMPLPGWGAGPPVVRCTADGSEAFALAYGGVAAGSVAYAGVEAVSNGRSVDQHVVLVSGLASGTFHPQGAYVDNDPYPGVFTVVGAGSVYLVNWCPACENGTFFIRTHGEPSAVGDRNELPAIDGTSGPQQPLGISFVDPDRGWILLQVPAPKGQQPLLIILATTDGGTTWAAPCVGPATDCLGAQSVP
jgi:photosystem II stability/assembly factor-like uncharacterized protein